MHRAICISASIFITRLAFSNPFVNLKIFLCLTSVCTLLKYEYTREGKEDASYKNEKRIDLCKSIHPSIELTTRAFLLCLSIYSSFPLFLSIFRRKRKILSCLMWYRRLQLEIIWWIYFGYYARMSIGSPTQTESISPKEKVSNKLYSWTYMFVRIKYPITSVGLPHTKTSVFVLGAKRANKKCGFQRLDLDILRWCTVLHIFPQELEHFI